MIQETIKNDLPNEFIGKGEVKGFKFTQRIANSRAFVYEVDSGRSKHYEVFLRKWNDRFDRFSYPSSKAFGVWAWCIKNYDRAIQKFNSL